LGEKRKKLVIISGKLVKGGSERVISILAGHFAGTHDVSIVTVLSEKVEYEIPDTVNIINLSRRDRLRLLKAPLWLLGLMKVFISLKKENSVLISFVARINTLTLLANLFTGIPVIISERNDPAMDKRGPLTKMLVNLLYPRAQCIVFQSEYAMSLFKESIRRKGVVIHNPIGPFDQYKMSTKKKSFVTVGRLSEQKNQTMLITAFEKVHLLHPEYELHIYGEGPLKERLEALCLELGVSESVFIKKPIDNIHEELASHGIFVLSSDYEGQSNALLEAMELGLPCISTDLPGHRGIVTDENAILVDSGNLVQLADAMIGLVEDQQKRERISEKASADMKKLEKYKILEKWNEITEALYEE